MSDTQALPVRAEWVIDLDKPIEWQGGTFAQVKLREPTIGELQKASRELGAAPSQSDQIAMQIVLVSLVSGLNRQVVERLPFSIVTGAADWLMGFTPPAPPTRAS